ncbi:MAG: Cytidylate kinase [Elusimicrobia bacterium ADurb.Bin231]|nr:MAG: Cytidylate kinase [Elusimicrobia bacterium ADurb.Bin231]
MKKKYIIAIDGPAGAGKSSIAKMVAKKLGFVYIDTGAMYRAVTWKVLNSGIGFNNKNKISEMTKKTSIELKYTPEKLKVYVDGTDVTESIRSQEVTLKTNIISSIQEVRNVLREKQRQLGKTGGVVMEGRDIGTYVFPAAEFKFYLDAKPRERALRRWNELKAKGRNVDLKEITLAIYRRDYCDRHRGISPLKKAPGAIVIDSTNMTQKEVAEKILKTVGMQA